MTEVMDRAAPAEADTEALPLLPFSFEAVLGERLRGVSPRTLAALLDRYLLVEATIAVRQVGENPVERGSLALFHPSLADSAERFEAVVREAGLPPKVERALLDAAAHMPVGEDVVGALVRIVQRVARERGFRLAEADRAGVLGLDISGGDAGRLALEHAAARSGHAVRGRGYRSSAFEDAIEAAFEGLGDEIGHALTEAEHRALVTAAAAMLGRLSPFGPPMPIERFEDRLGTQTARLVVERLHRAGLVRLLSNGTVALALSS